jgi:hypothetical protein
MSKIRFAQISEDEVEVLIPSETPMEMVQQLTKSFLSKGLVEDLKKSTLSTRYFYKPKDKANDLADKLIKSLEDISGLSKADEYTKMKWEQRAQSQLVDRNRRRAELGLQPITMDQIKNPQNYKPATPTNTAPPPAPEPQTGPKTLTGGPNKLLGEVGYGGFAGTTKKNEDCECGEEDCDVCVSKSNYGPKGGGQYTPADNARRKMNNTGETHGIGPNVNAKSYSSKPGQLSGKQSANLTARIQNAANKKQPVKTWSPEEIAEENKKRGLTKSAWANHNQIPSAEEEILRLAKATAESGEVAAANQLANLMMGKGMLGKDAHPVVQAMMAPPPPQPTDEQMFGHLVVSEEMAKNAENQWKNGINNWMVEAAKPISKRFASEEEEIAYWNNLKVNDSGDDHGY